MGILIKAKCECGYESDEIYFGEGMRRTPKYLLKAPAVCRKCGDKVLVRNYQPRFFSLLFAAIFISGVILLIFYQPDMRDLGISLVLIGWLINRLVNRAILFENLLFLLFTFCPKCIRPVTFYNRKSLRQDIVFKKNNKETEKYILRKWDQYLIDPCALDVIDPCGFDVIDPCDLGDTFDDKTDGEENELYSKTEPNNIGNPIIKLEGDNNLEGNHYEFPQTNISPSDKQTLGAVQPPSANRGNFEDDEPLQFGATQLTHEKIVENKEFNDSDDEILTFGATTPPSVNNYVNDKFAGSDEPLQFASTQVQATNEKINEDDDKFLKTDFDNQDKFKKKSFFEILSDDYLESDAGNLDTVGDSDLSAVAKMLSDPLFIFWLDRFYHDFKWGYFKLPRAKYWCPKCKEMKMDFSWAGMWD